jgi:hypothetical protein
MEKGYIRTRIFDFGVCWLYIIAAEEGLGSWGLSLRKTSRDQNPHEGLKGEDKHD